MQTKEEPDPRKSMNYSLVRSTDMHEEERAEALEVIVTAIEKYQGKYESAAKHVKETMDRKFGLNYHCVIGQGFGFEITHERGHLLYVFHGGELAILLFKG